MSSAAGSSQPRKRSIPLILTLPILLICGVALQASFVLVLLGCLPTITAYYADTTNNRLSMMTIACCNIAGILPYPIEFQAMGHGMAHLSSYLADATMWLSMYGTAAVGYILVKGCPLLSQTMIYTVYKGRIFKLRDKQDALVSRWGENIIPHEPEEKKLPKKGSNTDQPAMLENYNTPQQAATSAAT